MYNNTNAPESFSWGKLIFDMKLQGLPAMIACHTEPLRYDANGPVLFLQVSKYLQELADTPAMDRLRSALKDHFGDALQLEISFGSASQSPAAIAFNRRVGHYTQAYSNIAQDDVIGQIIKEFGAKIIVESIHPVKRVAP